MPEIMDTTVAAVHEEDLLELLDKIGIKGRLLEGRLRCSACGRIIRLEDLGAVRVEGDQPLVVCATSECLRSFQ